MPGIPFPGRPGGEHDEPLLDMLFGERALPPGAPPEMHDLARTLAALAGPADPSELAGEAAARAAFTRFASPARISPHSGSPRPARHRLPRRPARRRLSRLRPATRRPVRRTTVAKVLLGATAMVGGIAAAYSGVLPGPIQQMAHVTINAPAPPATTHPGREPVKHDHARPAPVPDSQPTPPRGTGQPRWPGQDATPVTPGPSASCGPGPYQPQDLPPAFGRGLPSGLATLRCAGSATSAPSVKASGSTSALGQQNGKVTPAPSKTAQNQ